MGKNFPWDINAPSQRRRAQSLARIALGRFCRVGTAERGRANELDQAEHYVLTKIREAGSPLQAVGRRHFASATLALPE